MKIYQFFKIISLFVFLFFLIIPISYASIGSGINVNLDVGGCNNDGVCNAGEEDIFSCPADCTPSSSGNHGHALIPDSFFDNLSIKASYNSAVITWKSAMPTTSNLRWGTNPDYKDGILSNINFLLKHKIELINLTSNTLYYFNIQSIDILGRNKFLNNKIFNTLYLLDLTPPNNPTNLNIVSSSSGITIYWKNPTDEDFDYIRVIRNNNRYYNNPSVGYLVYEGRGTYFTDNKVKENKKYFYSLFSRDKNGNYSSGSLISKTHNPSGKDNLGKEIEPIKKIIPFKNIFKVTQDSSNYYFNKGNNYPLSGDKKIGIKINYFEEGKDDGVWVDIRNSEGAIISQYFFSKIKDKDGFMNITIPSFDKEGDYTITVYKYKNTETQIINRGVFHIYKNKIKEQKWSLVNIFWIGFIIVFILLLTSLLLRVILPKIYKYIKK